MMHETKKMKDDERDGAFFFELRNERTTFGNSRGCIVLYLTLATLHYAWF